MVEKELYCVSLRDVIAFSQMIEPISYQICACRDSHTHTYA
jgi:hypothetical protein